MLNCNSSSTQSARRSKERSNVRAALGSVVALLLWASSSDSSIAHSSVEPVLLGRGGAQVYTRIGDAIGGARVVALGESIHLTREMPIVRLEIVKHLHRERQFGVLALEGSLIETWTALEHTYRSEAPLPERARTFAREAWFGLWQTEEMEAVAAYALSTRNDPAPLYLASFDLQPGYAFAYRGSAERSLMAFLSALQSASPALDDTRISTWVRNLAPALACRAGADGQSAVDEIAGLIESDVVPAMENSRPDVHVRTLRLAPLMLRNRLQHCREIAASGGQMYQASRDRLNADLVQAMLATEPRVMLWAHHSHVHHNSTNAASASMGQYLKAVLGRDLYTIGVFANGGTAIDSVLADQGDEGLAPRPVPQGPELSMEANLAKLETSDFFVDLREATGIWQESGSSRLEVNGSMPTIPARDFDGAILLHHVSSPWLTFLPKPHSPF